MDAPTNYFFNLERSVAQRKYMFYLKRSDGSLTSNPVEMRRMAVDFYAELYEHAECDVDSI